MSTEIESSDQSKHSFALCGKRCGEVEKGLREYGKMGVENMVDNVDNIP